MVSGDMTFSYAFVAKEPLAFFFLLLFLPLLLNTVWTVCFFVFRGSFRSPSYVDLEVDNSRLIFLSSGWSSFSRRLNLRDGDMLCCRFDGESTVTVRAFDPSGNNMDPHGQESSSDRSTRSGSPSPASSMTPSSTDSSGDDAVPISSEEDLDVKPSIKRARQATL